MIVVCIISSAVVPISAPTARAAMTYSQKVLLSGVPDSGTTWTQNDVTFSSAPNNSGITVANNGGAIVASASDSFKSGDYIRFYLNYPVTSATHNDIISYEYTVKFSGTSVGDIKFEAYNINNQAPFSKTISTTDFTLNTDYVIALNYDIYTGNYAIKVKRLSDDEEIISYDGTIDASAGLKMP